MGDHTQHQHLFRPVATLFSKRHYGNFEPSGQHHVDIFSHLLTLGVKANKACNIALGFRCLSLAIVNDFMFSSIQTDKQCLIDKTFEDPLTLTTLKSVNWTLWFLRNFPTLDYLMSLVPLSLLGRVTNAWDEGAQVRQVSINHVVVSLSYRTEDRCLTT